METSSLASAAHLRGSPIFYSLSLAADVPSDSNPPSRAVETALGQEMARSMCHFQVRKWQRAHRALCKKALAHPSNPPQKNTTSFFGDPVGGAYNEVKRQKAEHLFGVPLSIVACSVLGFFLRDDFLPVVITAVLADAVRNFQLMAVRALDKRRSRCLIVCKTLVRSALGLFSLGDCHNITSLPIYSSLYSGAEQPSAQNSAEGSANSTVSRKNSPKSTMPFR